MRAISTVLDVAVFLLLVSSAVATLALAPAGDAKRVTVDDRANVLATTTAEVAYTLHDSKRRAHGTIASLLARGAVANTTIDGKRLSAGDAHFISQVRRETRAVLDVTNRTQVVARWQPYRNAPVTGTVTVGPAPPPRTDVSVATVTVPAQAPAVHDAAVVSAERDGYSGVAAVTAGATADALLPKTRVGLFAGRESPATAVASSRFRRLASATGTSVTTPLSNGKVTRARRRIVEGLTARFTIDMQNRFESPTAAANAVRTGTVRLTLKRWGS